MTESGGHTRSEAVYLDVVSDDGEWAMVARLCRYPQRGVQWAWLHVFAGAQVYSFTDHGIACGAAFTDLDAACDAVSDAIAAGDRDRRVDAAREAFEKCEAQGIKGCFENVAAGFELARLRGKGDATL